MFFYLLVSSQRECGCPCEEVLRCSVSRTLSVVVSCCFFACFHRFAPHHTLNVSHGRAPNQVRLDICASGPPAAPLQEDALTVGLTECLQMGALNLQALGSVGGPGIKLGNGCFRPTLQRL